MWYFVDLAQFQNIRFGVKVFFCKLYNKKSGWNDGTDRGTKKYVSTQYRPSIYIDKNRKIDIENLMCGFAYHRRGINIFYCFEKLSESTNVFWDAIYLK